MKQGEYISLVCFLIVVVLWVTRDPDESVDGWAELFPVPGYMTDGMSVVLIGIMLFVLPLNESGLFAIFNCFRKPENHVDISKTKILASNPEIFLRNGPFETDFKLDDRSTENRLGSFDSDWRRLRDRCGLGRVGILGLCGQRARQAGRGVGSLAHLPPLLRHGRHVHRSHFKFSRLRALRATFEQTGLPFSIIIILIN